MSSSMSMRKLAGGSPLAAGGSNSLRKSSTLRAYSAEASAPTRVARLVSPTMVTPCFCTVLSASVSGQLPPTLPSGLGAPLPAAMSMMTEPGFMLFTMSSVISTGAARPGISAVEITTSACATRLATSTFWRSSQLGGMGRA